MQYGRRYGPRRAAEEARGGVDLRLRADADDPALAPGARRDAISTPKGYMFCNEKY
mgnify:CR=1 FL=1